MTSAFARLGTERHHRGNGRPATAITTLRSGWPLMLRTTAAVAQHAATDWAARDTAAASVHLAAGGAGPLGGDRLRLQVEVGPGSALVLSEVSPTLVLPGAHGEESRTEIDIHVGAGATLARLPQLVIAARGCRHRTDTRVTLDSGARLLLREEVLFGRHAEPAGTLRQRLRVVTCDRPIYDQELASGPGTGAWDGPAVTGGHRSLGAILVVDPGRLDDVDHPANATTAVMTLPEHAVLVSALAHETTTLRRRLDAALTRVVRSDVRAG